MPAPAVQYGSRGTYVYLVNAEGKATVRDIVLGPADGNAYEEVVFNTI